MTYFFKGLFILEHEQAREREHKWKRERERESEADSVPRASLMQNSISRDHNLSQEENRGSDA